MLLFPGTGSLDEIIAANSVILVIWSAVALGILAIISLKTKKLTALGKKILFGSIVLVVLLPTLYMAISTIYLNMLSQSGGPVHWHADIEIWNCGQEIDLKDPEGLSNKIGTPVFHEHNDKRLHVEGVVVHEQNVSISRFFHVIGGEFNGTSLTVPTNQGTIALRSGQTCPTGEQATLQVFVYQAGSDGYYTQKKVSKQYVLSPEQNVPPGDCIIIEYGPEKERTDKICRSYQVAEEIGKLKGERR